MTPGQLKKVKRELLDLRKSPHGLKAKTLISLAMQVGRVVDKRGKEPTYVRKIDPELSPPLSIPSHKGREMKVGTARNIIDALLDDVSEWELYLLEDDDETE